jgi:hypothetical protein
MIRSMGRFIDSGRFELYALVSSNQREPLRSKLTSTYDRLDLPDVPGVLEQTRQYLLDAQKLLSTKPIPLKFYNQMIALHPDRINPGSLWSSALALLGKDLPGDRRSALSAKTLHEK